MFFIHGKTLDLFDEPSFFSNKITVNANCELTHDEIMTFNDTLRIVALYAVKYPPAVQFLSLNIYFSADKYIFLCEPDSNALGSYSQMVFYFIGRWRELKLSPTQIQLIMLEELCHAIWRIPDGILMEEKINAIFRNSGIDINYKDFLNNLPLNAERNN